MDCEILPSVFCCDDERWNEIQEGEGEGTESPYNPRFMALCLGEK